jgi:hypothetical protein
VGSGATGRFGKGCTEISPFQSGRCGTNRHHSPGLRAGPPTAGSRTGAPARRYSPKSCPPTGTSGSDRPAHPPERVASSSDHLWSARSDVRAPLLNRQAQRRPMGLRVGRVDHDDPGVLLLSRQFGHDRGEHAHPAPPLPSVVERLRRAISCGRVRAGPLTGGGLSPHSTSTHCVE